MLSERVCHGDSSWYVGLGRSPRSRSQAGPCSSREIVSCDVALGQVSTRCTAAPLLPACVASSSCPIGQHAEKQGTNFRGASKPLSRHDLFSTQQGIISSPPFWVTGNTRTEAASHVFHPLTNFLPGHFLWARCFHARQSDGQAAAHKASSREGVWHGKTKETDQRPPGADHPCPSGGRV